MKLNEFWDGQLNEFAHNFPEVEINYDQPSEVVEAFENAGIPEVVEILQGYETWAGTFCCKTGFYAVIGDGAFTSGGPYIVADIQSGIIAGNGYVVIRNHVAFSHKFDLLNEAKEVASVIESIEANLQPLSEEQINSAVKELSSCRKEGNDYDDTDGDFKRRMMVVKKFQTPLGEVEVWDCHVFPKFYASWTRGRGASNDMASCFIKSADSRLRQMFVSWDKANTSLTVEEAYVNSNELAVINKIFNLIDEEIKTIELKKAEQRKAREGRRQQALALKKSVGAMYLYVDLDNPAIDIEEMSIPIYSEAQKAFVSDREERNPQAFKLKSVIAKLKQICTPENRDLTVDDLQAKYL